MNAVIQWLSDFSKGLEEAAKIAREDRVSAGYRFGEADDGSFRAKAALEFAKVITATSTASCPHVRAAAAVSNADALIAALAKKKERGS